MNRVIILIVILFPISSSGMGLNASLPYDRGATDRTAEQINASYITYDVIKNYEGSGYHLSSLTNLDNSDVWYVFSKKLYIYGVNVPQKKISSTLFLSRWQGELTPEINSFYRILGGRREPDVLKDEYSYQFHPGGFETSMGCLMETPLRYGDVLALPGNELVVFLGEPMGKEFRGMRTLDVVIISPEQPGIAFAMRAAREDQGSAPGEEGSYREPEPELPQFLTGTDAGSTAPAVRIYAKFYIGAFNDDGAEDIVVWRKRYLPNLIENPVKGFYLEEEMFNHYRLTDHSYQLVETDEGVIRSWLTSNNLTWQSGFPTYSECPDEEGELIPEMHDPILNDPDLLQ